MSLCAFVLDWLVQPLSGAGEHHIAGWAAWHGRAMVAGWGILIPLGILVARYAKVMPRQRWPEELDNASWWRWHLRLQYSGILLALIGLALAFGRGSGASIAADAHALAGWALMALGVAQVAAGLLRGSKGGPTGEYAAQGSWRGDHYDMTPRRLRFERLHKGGGLLGLLLTAIVVALGLIVADAPRWMAIVIGGWWLLLAFAAVVLQRRGRCIDTYQAIWGPDPIHPGNRRAPIGIGVRQLAPGEPLTRGR